MMLGRRAGRSKRQTVLGVPEYVVGSVYEHCCEDEPPLIPLPAVDVRSLELDARRRSGCLRFVEADWFQLLVGILIVGNLIIVVDHLVHPEDAAHLWVADELILALFALELLLRIVHYGRRFFWDTWSYMAWNWLDTLLVCSGVLVKFIQTEGQHQILALRAMRVLRLLRIARIVHAVRRGDFRWVESARFQSLVGTIIAVNAVVMGIETSMHSPLFWWIEQAMLSFFVFEIAVRLRNARLATFFRQNDGVWWTILDLVIVVTGIADQWVVPFLSMLQQGSSTASQRGIGQMMMLVRMLRLTRILRLLRLVKTVRPLYNLAIGIVRAMQSMFWVLVLTMVALYACAILTTNLFGKAMAAGADQLHPETRALFGSVPDSFFTLFGLMNGQYWQAIRPLFEVLPWTKPMWAIFTILSSWALLSVMTGVVSDNMLEVRQMQERQDSEQAEDLRASLNRTLTEIFISADKDGSGGLEKQEYMDLLSSPFHKRKLQRLANVPMNDLVNMFDWIDVDASGSIDFEEFMHGFDFMNEPVTGKSLLKLESAVRQRILVLEKSTETLRNELVSLQQLRQGQVQDALSLMRRARDRYEKEVALREEELERAQDRARYALERCKVNKKRLNELLKTDARYKKQLHPHRAEHHGQDQIGKYVQAGTRSGRSSSRGRVIRAQTPAKLAPPPEGRLSSIASRLRGWSPARQR